MHRISLVLVGALMSLSTLSYAADQYTYRAGQAYMKTSAGNYNECEAQCRGDAACRGWNFIQPNPRSQSGICEFNARKVAPVSSPISISGEINTSIDRLMSRAVPTANGNTVRVGTPIVQRQIVAPRQVSAPKMTNTPQRIINRTPVEQIIRAPIPAGYKPISQVKMRPLTGPMKPRSMTRQQIYNEQMLAAQKRAEAQTKIQSAQYSVAVPRPPQQFVPKMRQAPVQRPRQAPVIPVGAPLDQQSLYGSLHDDLTQNMTPVPRPRTAPDQMRNPNAPLATSRAIPVVPVQSLPFGYPARPNQGVMGQEISQRVPGLAGG